MIGTLLLESASPASTLLRSGLPAIGLELAGPPGGELPGPELRLSLDEWQNGQNDLLQLDDAFHLLENSRFCLRLQATSASSWTAVGQILSRYQRYLPLPSHAASVPHRVLRAHRALHDLERPLVRADYDHALDTWRWLLRLTPRSSTALQLAALFHDVERLTSEATTRVEHEASDYLRFKREHARVSATLTETALRGLGLDQALVRRTCELVEHHEQPAGDPDLIALNDADALSFFSLNSAGYLRYFGAAQTRAKVAYTLSRMSLAAAAVVPELRMPAPVVHFVSEVSPAAAATASAVAAGSIRVG